MLTATHRCGQEEVERQELKPRDAVAAADAVEFNSLVVIDVKPAVLGDSKQCLRMQEPGRRGQRVRGHSVIQSRRAVSPPLTPDGQALTGCPALPP